MCENCRSYGSERFQSEQARLKRLRSATPAPPTMYGWSWIDGETDDEIGNRWIEIGPLDENGFLTGEEMAIIMLRNAVKMEKKFPGSHAQREAHAIHIVNALNAYSLAGAANANARI